MNYRWTRSGSPPWSTITGTPTPRLDFAPAIREFATASVDVSDGLAADLGHIGARQRRRNNPEPERPAAVGRRPGVVRPTAWTPSWRWKTWPSGGDDYEIAFTAHPRHEEALRREADRRLVRLTRIGEVVPGAGLTAIHDGRPVEMARCGWTHG